MFRFGHFLNLNLNFALSSNLNAEPNFEINTDQGSDLLPSPTLAGLWARDLYFLLPRVLVIPSLGYLALQPQISVGWRLFRQQSLFLKRFRQTLLWPRLATFSAL
jgi:hypothetical protein